MTYKQNRQLNNLIDKISTETGVEKSVIVHFLLVDLNRIYTDKIFIHAAKLKSTEHDFFDLSQKEKQLLQKIEKRDKEISESQKIINELNSRIETTQLKYTEIQEALKELRNKYNDLNLNLSTLEKEKKQVEFNVMMKSHSIKEKYDVHFKTIGWILTGFTILGIIIAIILILKK